MQCCQLHVVAVAAGGYRLHTANQAWSSSDWLTKLRPWNLILFEKLPVAQLPKGFPNISLPFFCTDPDQPTLHSLWSILMLSSHLCLNLRSGLLTSGFPTKTMFTLLCHACYIPCACRVWLDHSNSTRRGVMKLLVMHSSPRFYYFVLRKCKYSPQHRVLRHLRSMFVAHHERPSLVRKIAVFIFKSLRL